MEIISASLLAGAQNASGITVVIDVFRAFTTSAMLFEYGLKELLLVDDIESARSLAKEQGYLLVGEEKGQMPSGFDLGNSPTLIMKQGRVGVQGRTAVLRTSAGTRGAIAASRGSTTLLLGSFVTAGATARAVRAAIAATQEDLITLVAIGINGKYPSIEDTACADYLEHLLTGTEYSHLGFIQSLFCDTFTEETLSGKRSYFPPSDIVLSIQRDLFDFALLVKARGTDLLVSRIN